MIARFDTKVCEVNQSKARDTEQLLSYATTSFASHLSETTAEEDAEAELGLVLECQGGRAGREAEKISSECFVEQSRNSRQRVGG